MSQFNWRFLFRLEPQLESKVKNDFIQQGGEPVEYQNTRLGVFMKDFGWFFKGCQKFKCEKQ